MEALALLFRQGCYDRAGIKKAPHMRGTLQDGRIC